MLLLHTEKLFCDSAAIRTQDPRLRRALLYPAELPGRNKVNYTVFLQIVQEFFKNK